MKKKEWYMCGTTSLIEHYCRSLCPFRYSCHHKNRVRPPLEWCAGCKIKLYCLLHAADENVQFRNLKCPECGFSNDWDFPRCLCHGASPTGRLTFRCHGCGTTLFFGTGKWGKK